MDIIDICGILVDMLLDITPDVYGLYVTTERKGIKKIINQCMNAIYGNVVASILYYCKFFKTLKLNKFKMNPYYPCDSNRIVNGSQKSILSHVDYCKLNYKDSKVNDIFIGIIRDKYHSIFEDGSGTMQVNHGKVHKYLGMTLDYTIFTILSMVVVKITNQFLVRFFYIRYVT